jgi:hypothetical protein
MKKIFFCLIVVFLSGCNLFPEKIGKVGRGPKHDVSMFGSYIKEVGNSYHLFSIGQQCDNPVYPEGTPYVDTLTVDGKLYRQVFFVQVIPKNLDKNAKNLENLVPCVLRDIMANDSVRKEMPGFGNRRFLVIEKVVGLM